MNYCRGCDKDFRSLADFDSHRHSEKPGDWANRRCLSWDELVAKGFEQDGKRRWSMRRVHAE